MFNGSWPRGEHAGLDRRIARGFLQLHRQNVGWKSWEADRGPDRAARSFGSGLSFSGWVWGLGWVGLGWVLVGETQRHESESGSAPLCCRRMGGRQPSSAGGDMHAGTRAVRFCLAGAGRHRCRSVKATAIGRHRNTNWATVSALFRKTTGSYRFQRAAAPCSGRYVSRQPRGRRRWPVSG